MATKYDISKIRKKMKAKSSGRFKDPNEFRPDEPREGKILKYRFFILPPLSKDCACAEGKKASRDMELFYVPNGSHWFNSRPYPCPKVHDDEECPACDFAWDLMDDFPSDKKKRSEIAKTYLPRTHYAMNIYFLNTDANPEDLRGKVMWFNPSKQVYDVMEDCLYNDEPGDPEDPQPYGVFYDEEAAYVFQLEVAKENNYRSYKSSKFLVNTGKRPLVMKKVDGKLAANDEAISDVLNRRYDLYTKFEDRNVGPLKEVIQKILKEDTSGDDSGFDVDEVASAPAGPVAQEASATVLSGERPVETESSADTESDDAKGGDAKDGDAKDDGDVSQEEIDALLGQINEDD